MTRGASARTSKDAKAEAPSAAGVAISHPDRVFATVGVTKLALARYYESIADRMLPHVVGRPLTLLLWNEHDADAGDKGGIFMRHSKAWGPKRLRRVKIKEKTKVGEYLVVDDVPALVSLPQMNVLEIHTWNSRADDVDRPDRVVFDLDPGEGITWRDLVSAAESIRDRLEELGLRSWAKTTGGKGIHVVVPLTPSASWDECFEFARAFATVMVRNDPDRFVAMMGKQNRRGKIFIDYLRNNRTNTSVAAFSIRSRSGGPVSMPVSWAKLGAVDPSSFTMTTVPAIVRRAKRDPWADYFECEQGLPPIARRA